MAPSKPDDTGLLINKTKVWDGMHQQQFGVDHYKQQQQQQQQQNKDISYHDSITNSIITTDNKNRTTRTHPFIMMNDKDSNRPAAAAAAAAAAASVEVSSSSYNSQWYEGMNMNHNHRHHHRKNSSLLDDDCWTIQEEQHVQIHRVSVSSIDNNASHRMNDIINRGSNTSSNIISRSKKRKAQSLLDDDICTDDDNDSHSKAIAQHMKLYLPSKCNFVGDRAAQLPFLDLKSLKRNHSMIDKKLSPSTYSAEKESAEQQEEEGEDIIHLTLPPPLLVSDKTMIINNYCSNSHKYATNKKRRSSSSTLGSNEFPDMIFSRTNNQNKNYGRMVKDPEVYKHHCTDDEIELSLDRFAEGHSDDDDDEQTTMMLSLPPKLKRQSTIRDPFDLAASIETFRSSISEQQLQYGLSD